MKILSVATFSHPDHFGGAERVITDVAEGLAARGHEVTLLTGTEDDLPPSEERRGVRVERYPLRRESPGAFYGSVWSGVRRALESGAGERADVVHLHQVASAVPALAPGIGRRPTVASFYAPYHEEYLARFRDGHERGQVPWRSRAVAAFLRRADRYVVSRADELLVLSEFSRSQVAALDPRSAARTVVAPPGVDLERFHPVADEAERRRLAASFGLPEAPLVVSVRRLVQRMGLADLLDAVARVWHAGQAVHLAVAGGGPLRRALEARAQELGLGRSITFLGFVPDERLPELYRAASVFALPTRSLEGFGMATAEALASGLPVVATDAGATTEVLAPLEHPRRVPAGDVEALGRGLAELLGDDDLRARAAREARDHAEARLDWSAHLDALLAAAERARGRHR